MPCALVPLDNALKSILKTSSFCICWEISSTLDFLLLYNGTKAKNMLFLNLKDPVILIQGQRWKTKAYSCLALWRLFTKKKVDSLLKMVYATKI